MTNKEIDNLFDKYVSMINNSFNTDFSIVTNSDFPFTETVNACEVFLVSESCTGFRFPLGKNIFEAGQRLISIFHFIEQFDKIQTILRKDANKISIFFIDS